MYVRTVEGRETTFGVSGRLWRDALVLYDRDTRSYWSQIDGRAIAGQLAGERLTEVPSIVTTWKEWKLAHPDTLVLRPSMLSRDGSNYENYFYGPELGIFETRNPDKRLSGKTIVLGIESRGATSAVPLSLLEERSPLNGHLDDSPIVVVALGDDGVAYRRILEERILEFDSRGPERMGDRQTASLWNVQTGKAIEGPLEGATLQRLATRRSYWFIWARFHPQTGVLDGEGESSVY